MRNIAELSKYLLVWGDETLKRVKESQIETAEKIKDDIKGLAPGSGNYRSSIKVGKQEEIDGIIKIPIFTDLNANWEKHPEVALGALIEWGTGPLGESTNSYEHGFPYTTDVPWNAPTWAQFRRTGTWGGVAQPHFLPGLYANKKTYRANIRKAVRGK